MAIFLLIGVAATMNITSPSFQSSNSNIDSEEMNNEIPADYRIYEILGTEACSCLGNTYSDDLPPDVDVRSPPNNSLVLVDTIIYIEAWDNFPAGMVGGINFVPEYIMYHWNNATSNNTVYDAGIDGEPPDEDGIVRIEITLPNDDAGATHVLYFYAVDYENNWTSFVLIYSTAGVGEESSVTWTTTTTTTTTVPRRTDGFLLIPMILILIGSVNIIAWKRRRKE